MLSDTTAQVHTALRSAWSRFVIIESTAYLRPSLRIDADALTEVVTEIVEKAVTTRTAALTEQRRTLWQLLLRQSRLMRRFRALAQGREQELRAADGYIGRLEHELAAAQADVEHWRGIAGEVSR